MSKINKKLTPVLAIAVMLVAMMVTNSIAVVNAQENQTQGNQTNQTSGGAVVVTKIDVDPLMKALKDAYPKVGDVKDPQGLVDALKDIKDPKEVVRNMIAAGLLHDLEKFKAVQDSE
jgi:Holliday junction resolvase RusA-like endonuclease